MTDDLAGPSQIATHLGISRHTVNGWIRKGWAPKHDLKVGRRKLWSLEKHGAEFQWIKENRRPLEEGE